MTLQETKDIILKWISSCETVEQLGLLKPVIISQWLPRFEKKNTELEMIIAKEDLVNAVNDRTNLIIKNNIPSNVPTLDSYLND